MLSTSMHHYFAILSLLPCLLLVHTQTCRLPLNPDDCDSCTDPGLDLSTGCTTCVEQGPIECTPGQQGCGVGNFTFSARFHSYANPTHMCQDCEPRTCKNNLCRLRFLYCLQPYGASISDPPLVFQKPRNKDTWNFGNGFIVQDWRSGDPNFWNRSNPFTREFQTWPGRVQFYIITYHRPPGGGATDIKAMDRFEIDLELNISTNFTVRTTYFGKHRLSQFDLSFKLEGECGENYYGPLCDRFCQGGGELSCDSEGNRICGSSSGLDPTTNCTTCLMMGREVANNCTEVPTTVAPTTAPETTSTSSATTTKQPLTNPSAQSPPAAGVQGSTRDSSGLPAATAAGMVGGVVGGVFLIIIVILLVVTGYLFVEWRKDRKSGVYAVYQDEQAHVSDGQEGDEEDRLTTPSQSAVKKSDRISARGSRDYESIEPEMTIVANQGAESRFDNPIYRSPGPKASPSKSAVLEASADYDNLAPPVPVRVEEKKPTPRYEPVDVEPGLSSSTGGQVAAATSNIYSEIEEDN